MLESVGHKQMWVKVNAHVDEGVAGLVGALSAFPQLQTIESCQGTVPKGAWVCFRYGEDRPDACYDLAKFVVGYLGPGLAREVGDLADVSISISTWGRAQGEIAVRPGAMPRCLKALRKLARRFEG